MTAAWKQLVRDRLKENKRNGVKPWDQKTLGEAVGAADKSGINKMFKGNTCRFVPEICRVLNIAPSLEERPERDSLDEEMALVTDPAVREAFAALLRSYRTK